METDFTERKFYFDLDNCRWVEPIEAHEIVKEDHMLVPSIPSGVSGTALAASLLRDGWSVSH